MRPLRSLRPVFAREVETVVEPAYARRDELVSAIEDVRRLLADHLDASTEEAAVFGRLLTRLQASVEALADEVGRLTQQVEQLEAKAPQADR